MHNSHYLFLSGGSLLGLGGVFSIPLLFMLFSLRDSCDFLEISGLGRLPVWCLGSEVELDFLGLEGSEFEDLGAVSILSQISVSPSRKFSAHTNRLLVFISLGPMQLSSWNRRNFLQPTNFLKEVFSWPKKTTAMSTYGFQWRICYGM